MSYIIILLDVMHYMYFVFENKINNVIKEVKFSKCN